MGEFLSAASGLVTDLSQTIQTAKNSMVSVGGLLYVWTLTSSFFADKVVEVFWKWNIRIFGLRSARNNLQFSGAIHKGAVFLWQTATTPCSVLSLIVLLLGFLRSFCSRKEKTSSWRSSKETRSIANATLKSCRIWYNSGCSSSVLMFRRLCGRWFCFPRSHGSKGASCCGQCKGRCSASFRTQG